MHSSSLFPPLKAGTFQGTEAVVRIAVTTRIRKQFDLEGAEFNACAMGVVLGSLGRPGTVCWRRAAEVGVWGWCTGGVSACPASLPWINPPASWLSPDHGPSFSTAGDHCTCKSLPAFPATACSISSG
ncbi:hypothetical protein DV515_00010367 [Chloebia gouldiae]|uniref:Uncharacterized protein n=1 Tax=Chloebia gouldiae TaxID=44316 RepID=A0A3L8S955_CHLGU|nr:hypothetical protein DV515_00010367 [Chloebia gouldiae]